jgi:hypothetical protein
VGANLGFRDLSLRGESCGHTARPQVTKAVYRRIDRLYLMRRHDRKPDRLERTYGVAVLKVTHSRAAKASRLLSMVHNTASGVSNAEASSDISTAPQPES